MKWKIESVTHNEDPTITIRVAVLNDQGETLFHDQNSLPEDATQERIIEICNEMAAKHDKPPAKDFSYLVGIEG